MRMILAVYGYSLVQIGVQKCTNQWLSEYHAIRSIKSQHPWPYMSSQPLIMVTQD